MCLELGSEMIAASHNFAIQCQVMSSVIALLCVLVFITSFFLLSHLSAVNSFSLSRRIIKCDISTPSTNYYVVACFFVDRYYCCWPMLFDKFSNLAWIMMTGCSLHCLPMPPSVDRLINMVCCATEIRRKIITRLRAGVINFVLLNEFMDVSVYSKHSLVFVLDNRDKICRLYWFSNE